MDRSTCLHRYLSVFCLVFLTMMVSFFKADAAPLLAPSINVSPNQGLAGITVTINGSGYTPNAAAEIHWDGTKKGQFIIPGSGNFSVNFVIPNGASPGSHQIKVCAGCGMGEFEEKATKNFQVLAPPTYTPDPGPSDTPRDPPTRTPTPTPTTAPCQARISFIYPGLHEQLGGEAGLATTDLIIDVYYSAPFPLELIIEDRWDSRTVRLWPNDGDGVNLRHEIDPANSEHHTFVVEDVNLHFGHNVFAAAFKQGCPGTRTDYAYAQFGNGDSARGRIIPAACGDLALGPVSSVISFESGTSEYLSTSSEELYGMTFAGSLGIERVEGILTRSGFRAGASTVGMEFGSAGQYIQINFERPVQALGMYVGMEDVIDVSSDVDAVLNVYGYAAGSDTYGWLGSSSTSFAPEPTDILECLVYQGDPGDRITHARIDYLSEGVSIAERRLIDDLSFVFSAEDAAELPPDLPPVVEILQPDGSEIFTGVDIHLRADISEDRELVQTWFQVNDDEPQPVGFFSSSTDDPTQFSVVQVVSALGYDSSRINTLTIIAEDSAGQRGSDSVHLTIATPVPDLDISIVNYEFTQTVQCLHDRICGPDNSIPMFSGKPTLLRVYLDVTGTDSVVENISGRLCFNPTTCFLPVNQASVAPSSDPIAAYRGNLGGTLNFLIPQIFTLRAQNLEMYVEINPDGEILEGNYHNNNMSMGVRILQSNPINIVTIGVLSYGFSPNLESARADMYAYFEAVYPTANIRYLTFAGDALIVKDYDFANNDAFNGWNTLITDLSLKEAFNTWSSPGPTYWHGIVDYLSLQPGSASGKARRPGSLGGSSYDSDGGRWPDFSAATFAEEIGHNWGLNHLRGCNAGNFDMDMPISMRLGRGSSGSHQNLSWGIDLERTSYPWTMYGPDSFDFMGYCGNDGGGTITDGVVHGDQWVSAYTYKNLIRALYGGIVYEPASSNKVAAQAAQIQPDTFLIGALAVSPDSADLISGFYVVSLTPEQQGQLIDYHEQDAFLVEVMDQEGNLVSGRYFDAVENSNDEYAPDQGVLMVVLPWRPGANQLTVSHQDTKIGEFVASPGIPEITLLSPNGGELWTEDGTQRIEWLANDPDNDDLFFQVQYSIDNGETWASLGSEQSNTSFVEVDLSRLGGSQTAMVRVTVTDGFNTASDTSDAFFSVASKPPQVSLISPSLGQEYLNGTSVIMKAFALDFEDGEVADSAFEWSSDKDGSLGSGPSLWGIPLSSGQHLITVTVTDRDGNSTSKSVSIFNNEVVDGTEEVGPVPASSGEDPIDQKGQAGKYTLLLILSGLLLGGGILTWVIHTHRKNQP